MRRFVWSLICSMAFGLPLAGAAEPAKSDEASAALVGVVPMFDGMETGTLEARLIMKDAMRGKLIVKNVTDEDVTVAIPVAYGGKHTSAQFGGGGLGGGGLGGGGGGGQTTGGGGGGLGGGGFGGGGLGGDPGGFFSISAGKSLSVPYKSVCLEHGKPEPKSYMAYTPVPLDDVAENETLKAFIRGVADSRQSTPAMQAAAWHLTGMSWAELAAKKYDRAGLPDTPYFSRAQLQAASLIVAESKSRALEAAKKDTPRL